MDKNNSLSNSSNTSQFTNHYNPLNNANEILKTSVYSDYGQDWLVEGPKTFQELGENSLKLRYLEKSLKSKRRLEKRSTENEEVTYKQSKYDRNAVLVREFPFKSDEFRYPNDTSEMPKTVYVKYSDEYGSKKPNEMELPCINICY